MHWNAFGEAIAAVFVVFSGRNEIKKIRVENFQTADLDGNR